MIFIKLSPIEERVEIDQLKFWISSISSNISTNASSSRVTKSVIPRPDRIELIREEGRNNNYCVLTYNKEQQSESKKNEDEDEDKKEVEEEDEEEEDEWLESILESFKNFNELNLTITSNREPSFRDIVKSSILINHNYTYQNIISSSDHRRAEDSKKKKKKKKKNDKKRKFQNNNNHQEEEEEEVDEERSNLDHSRSLFFKLY